jgi:transposase
MSCAACEADLGGVERVGRRDTCPRCGADLHACRNCRFYAPRVAGECREPQAERVLDKTRGNFCDYFAPAAARPSGAPAPGSADARDALDRLFRRR